MANPPKPDKQHDVHYEPVRHPGVPKSVPMTGRPVPPPPAPKKGK